MAPWKRDDYLYIIDKLAEAALLSRPRRVRVGDLVRASWGPVPSDSAVSEEAVNDELLAMVREGLLEADPNEPPEVPTEDRRYLVTEAGEAVIARARG